MASTRARYTGSSTTDARPHQQGCSFAVQHASNLGVRYDLNQFLFSDAPRVGLMPPKQQVIHDDVRAFKGKAFATKQDGSKALTMFEEQDFDIAMRQAAIGAAVADEDGDADLTYSEFAALVREREVTDEDEPHTERELRDRFSAIDADGSGTISMSEYLAYSLRDGLARSSKRVIDLFNGWDKDRSGLLTRTEFRMVVKAMGFRSDAVADDLFRMIDLDGSGSITYEELNTTLRSGAGADDAASAKRRALKKRSQKPDEAPSGRVKAISFDDLAEASGDMASPGLKRMSTTMVDLFKLDSKAPGRIAPGELMSALWHALDSTSLRVIDFFRECDIDGDGRISCAEFKGAMMALGLIPQCQAGVEGGDLSAAAAAVDGVFHHLDPDGSGTIEFEASVRQSPSVAHSLASDTEPFFCGPRHAAPQPDRPILIVILVLRAHRNWFSCSRRTHRSARAAATLGLKRQARTQRRWTGRGCSASRAKACQSSTATASRATYWPSRRWRRLRRMAAA